MCKKKLHPNTNKKREKSMKTAVFLSSGGSREAAGGTNTNIFVA